MYVEECTRAYYKLWGQANNYFGNQKKYGFDVTNYTGQQIKKHILGRDIVSGFVLGVHC